MYTVSVGVLQSDRQSHSDARDKSNSLDSQRVTETYFVRDNLSRCRPSRSAALSYFS